jgi:aminopeptidase N
MIKFSRSPAFIHCIFLFSLFPVIAHSQPTFYRETPARINDLVNTKLNVRFDYKQRFLYGKEWIRLTPHFYPTDSLRLDAKGMDLKNISIVRNGKMVPLKFTYNGLSAAIQLDRTYHNNEQYSVYIEYTAKPDELRLKGSLAISGAKGLYFINPDGTEKDKPIQVWTQGETEGASAWFPTIDQTEQKTTDEIAMTVPAKYVTLSNGRMVSQKINGDGTRTDTWKMDLPHSPYLFMMAVGDFKIYHDKWRNREVNYYMEPEYAPYAKEIFGDTPEMLEFYSKILGVEYPWNKYSQIVVRDFVSGAMENTSATLHGAFLNMTHRELLDAYYDFGHSTIAHELFHQWFGDLVTAESWSNLTVNESFANFSETLWAEHKYGQDEADAHNYQNGLTYLSVPGNSKKNLVRFEYADPNDVFDAVTYQKGGRILNMLRNYLGDSAFFRGLKLYLKTNSYKTGEAHQLRLALEEASGLDLNWYFNQWYYGAGHPVLNITYGWDETKHLQTVYIQQTQEGQIFKIPLAIDIYFAGKKERHKVWISGKTDTLSFPVSTKPDLVNVDGDKMLLTQKTDQKTLNEFIFQYFNAPRYLDRFESITAASANQTDRGSQRVMLAALRDKYYGLRIKAISELDMTKEDIRRASLPILASLAQTDENTLVRAESLKVLGKLKSPDQLPVFKLALSNQSYAVQAAALIAINLLDPSIALPLAGNFEKDHKGALSQAILIVYATSGGAEKWPNVFSGYSKINAQEQFDLIRGPFAAMVGRMDNPEYVQQGINLIKEFGISYKQFDIAEPLITALNEIKSARIKLNDNASVFAADEAIKKINEAK